MEGWGSPTLYHRIKYNFYGNVDNLVSSQPHEIKFHLDKLFNIGSLVWVRWGVGIDFHPHGRVILLWLETSPKRWCWGWVVCLFSLDLVPHLLFHSEPLPHVLSSSSSQIDTLSYIPPASSLVSLLRTCLPTAFWLDAAHLPTVKSKHWPLDWRVIRLHLFIYNFCSYCGMT